LLIRFSPFLWHRVVGGGNISNAEQRTVNTNSLQGWHLAKQVEAHFLVATFPELDYPDALLVSKPLLPKQMHVFAKRAQTYVHVLPSLMLFM
jgi:hypothetical protein